MRFSAEIEVVRFRCKQALAFNVVALVAGVASLSLPQVKRACAGILDVHELLKEVDAFEIKGGTADPQ